jgi:hypothetical protein
VSVTFEHPAFVAVRVSVTEPVEMSAAETVYVGVKVVAPDNEPVPLEVHDKEV